MARQGKQRVVSNGRWTYLELKEHLDGAATGAIVAFEMQKAIVEY